MNGTSARPALSLVLCVLVQACWPGAAARGAQSKWAVMDYVSADHTITVELNGERLVAFEHFGSGTASVPLLLKEGRNTFHVRFSLREEDENQGEEQVDEASSLDIYLSPTRRAPDDAPLLAGAETSLGEATLNIVLEARKGRAGRVETLEREWLDWEARQLARERRTVSATPREVPDESWEQEWDDERRLSCKSHSKGRRLLTAECRKPDGTVGAVVKDGEGWLRSWGAKGQLLEETPIRGGVEDGVAREFYASGGILSVASWLKGKLQGGYLEYHENGALAVRGSYRNDLKFGLWIAYEEDGKQSARSVFSDGELVHGTETFDDW